MGNCYSIDHIAEAHLHTDITCNIEEPRQKYRPGTVSNRLLCVCVGGGGGRGLKHVSLDPNFAVCLCNGFTQQKQFNSYKLLDRLRKNI